MQLTRRNALIGMGTVAAGAGVIGGTGAFTSVEADRTVSVQTAGDGDAALVLEQAELDGSVTSNASEYVQETSGTVQINLDGTQGNSSDANAAGLNQNAKTRFDNLVGVANQGTQPITSLTLSMSGQSLSDTELTNTFKFTAFDKDSDSTADDISNGNDILDAVGRSNLGAGAAGINFGMIIDLINGGGGDGDLPNGDYTLTITANTS
jgi:hypothetical protein